MSKEFYTTNEAAVLLGIARTSLINWVDRGELKPAVTPGGHRRFRHADLVNFAAKHGFSMESASAAMEVAQQAKVLMVDDEDDFRIFARECLHVAGDFEIREATNGIDAALICGSWRPNIILLDLHMPKMDGFQFISQLRAKPDYAGIRIIVLTAYADQTTRDQIGEGVVDDIICKPIGIKDFVAKLRRYV